MQDTIFTQPATRGKTFKFVSLTVFFVALLFTAPVIKAEALDECLLDALQYADDSVTVGQLREQCREEAGTISRAMPQSAPAAENRADGPEEVILKTVQARKPAYFPHRRHQEKYTCGICHHGKDAAGRLAKYTAGMVISKCTNCHNAEMPNDELNGFQLIGHKLCRDCHRKNQDITSARCSACHPKTR